MLREKFLRDPVVGMILMPVTHEQHIASLDQFPRFVIGNGKTVDLGRSPPRKIERKGSVRRRDDKTMIIQLVDLSAGSYGMRLQMGQKIRHLVMIIVLHGR